MSLLSNDVIKKIQSKLFGITVNGYTSIVVASFIVLSLVKIILSLYFPSPFVMLDEYYYSNIAQNVLCGKLYVGVPYFMTVPPGYSMVISVAYLLSQDRAVSYHLALIINALLTSSMIFPAYLILKKYCSKSMSAAGSVMIAALPSVNMYYTILFSENLFTPLFLFTIWFLLEAYASNKKIWQLLAGVSITFLYMTRSTGLALIPGLVVSFIFYIIMNRGQRRVFDLIGDKLVLILSFLGSLFLWLTYSTFFTPKGSYSTIGTPYNVGGTYTNLLISSTSNLDVFINYLILLSHEIDYLLISTYLVILIAFAYMLIHLYRDDKTKKSPLSIVTTYFIVSSLGLLVISLTFMYDQSIIKGDVIFSIFGRYLEPALPPLFLFGIIGLDRLNKNVAADLKTFMLLSGMYLATMILLIFTLPTYYKFPDNPSIYYLNMIMHRVNIYGVYVFLAVFFLAMTGILYLSLRYKKLRPVLFAFLIISSFVLCIPSFITLLNGSESTANSNPIGQYLYSHSYPNSTIALDVGDFSTDNGKILYGLASIWTGEPIVLYDLTKLNLTTAHEKGINYIISSKIQPYDYVCETNGIKLYRASLDTSTGNSTPNIPYTINLGTNDGKITESFYQPEGSPGDTYRWTKGSSFIYIDYPRSNGDLQFSIVMGGARPDNKPINVRLSMNGTSIGNVSKPSGIYNYTFIVPSDLLSERYQVLEIDSDTWAPSQFGQQDNRLLGVTVIRITVGRSEHA